MKYSSSACDGDSCTISTSADTCTGSICLDKCGGYEGEIEHDEYKYRYYMVGATSDLYSLPSDPRPSEKAAAVFGFSINCYRGYTVDELNEISDTSGLANGTTSSFVPAEKTTPGHYTCISGCQESGGSSTDNHFFCSETTDSSCNSSFDTSSVQDYQCSTSGGDDSSDGGDDSSDGGDDSSDGGDSSASSDDDDTTQIALIAVGAVVGVAIVAGIGFVFCKIKK